MGSANTRTLDIGMLVLYGFQLPGAEGPIGAFEMPIQAMSPPPERLSLCSLDGGPVRVSCGLSMMTEALPQGAEARHIDRPRRRRHARGDLGCRTARSDPQSVAAHPADLPGLFRFIRPRSGRPAERTQRNTPLAPLRDLPARLS